MKKSMFKRLMAAMLVIIMMLSLVACNNQPADPTKGNDDPKPTQGKDPDPTTAPTEPALGLLDPYPETVTVTFSRLLDQVSTYPEGVTNDKNGYVQMAKDVLNIECVTKFEATSGEAYDRLTSLAIAGEDLPDFLYIYGDGLALVKELYENDLIMPLNELFETYADDVMKANYASYGDGIWDGVVFDGQKYALPYAAGNFYNMIWIRSDWMRELNITIDDNNDGIITREELVMVAKAFVDNDMSGTGNTIGLALNTNFATHGTQLTDSFGAFAGGYVANDDGTVSHGSTNPKMKDALAWLRDLYAQGILDPQYGTRSSSDINELLTNGQLGIFVGPWSFSTALKSIHEMNPEADFLSYNLDNGSGKVNFPSSSQSKGQYLVISKDCEHPEAWFKIYAQQNAYSAMAPADREAQFPELFAQVQAGMSGQARPVFIDILNTNFVFMNQTSPTLEYLKNGTTEYLDANGALKTYNTDPASNTYLRCWNTYHEDSTKMKSSDWVIYLSRFAGGGYHAYKLDQAGLYEKSTLISIQTDSMTSNPVDFDGMRDEYFIKIIVGELPLDAFDEYVTQRYAQGDDVICQELAEAIG